MKRLMSIPAFIFVYSMMVGCNNNHSGKDQIPYSVAPHWDTAHFPRIDTITVGLKSDSGRYALIKYYIERTDRDKFSIYSSANDNKIGNENWKVVSIRETMP